MKHFQQACCPWPGVLRAVNPKAANLVVSFNSQYCINFNMDPDGCSAINCNHWRKAFIDSQVNNAHFKGSKYAFT